MLSLFFFSIVVAVVEKPASWVRYERQLNGTYNLAPCSDFKGLHFSQNENGRNMWCHYHLAYEAKKVGKGEHKGRLKRLP